MKNDNVGLLFFLWFAFCLMLSLAFMGVVVWAIIELVQWVTSK